MTDTTEVPTPKFKIGDKVECDVDPSIYEGKFIGVVTKIKYVVCYEVDVPDFNYFSSYEHHTKSADE